MDLFSQVISQLRGLARFLFSLYLLPLFCLLAVVAASQQMDVSPAIFTRDMASVAQISPFAGVVSNLGVLLWTATATICLFSWAVLRHSPDQMRFATFLLCSGLMTTLLALDDLFLLHENIFPSFLGVNEKIMFAGYFGLILSGMVVFRNSILTTEYVALLVGLGFFGLSLFIDAVQYRIEPYFGTWRILFEDGFKLFGIVGWFGYFLRCCLVSMAK